MIADRPLPLGLPRRVRLGREDFLVTDANRRAFDAITSAQPGDRLALSGPGGCGKTHLASIWADGWGGTVLPASALDDSVLAALPEAPGLVIDDADTLAGTQREEALLHALNIAKAHGKGLLLTGRTPPARWQAELPDLASRLAALPHAAIAPPDDTLLSSILTKLFADRHLRVGEDVIEYLVRRMERSFAAAHRIVARLDDLALEERRPITRLLAARLVERDPAALSDDGDP